MTDQPDRRTEFTEFFTRNYRHLQMLAARLGVAASDREELVQDALSAVLAKWDEIEGSRYSYARVVLTNAVRKRRSRPGVRQVPLEEHHLSAWADEGDAPVTGELLEDGIARLPAHLRTVVEMRLAGYDNARIAAETDLGKNTVAVYWSQARKRLKRLIGSARDTADKPGPDTADGGDA